jgi:hypothetical protein
MSTETLRIFVNNEGDYVVASDPSDALIVMAEHLGYMDPGQYQRDNNEMPGDWTEVEDQPMTITVEDEGKLTKHTSVWIVENGRGYLCGPNG